MLSLIEAEGVIKGEALAFSIAMLCQPTGKVLVPECHKLNFYVCRDS